MYSLSWFVRQLMVTFTMAGMEVMVAGGITIPGHTQDTLMSLRRLVGKHYYPQGTVTPSYDLPAGLCLAQSALALVSSQPWSRTMWDASGKIADGIGAGGTETRGHPDLCEDVSAHFPGTLLSHLEPHQQRLALHNITLTTFSHEVIQQRDTTLRGRYCLVSVRGEEEVEDQGGSGGSWQLVRALAGKFEHSYATCVPDTCTESFLQESLQRQQVPGVFLTVTCHRQDHNAHPRDLSFLLVTAVLVVLVTAATMLDLYRPCPSAPVKCSCLPGKQLLHCFSLTQNWTQLMSHSTAETHLQTLDGIRVTSMMWVILAHRYMFFLISAANPRDITKHMRDWRYWWVFNAYPSVDTFLFISAFLVSIFLKKRIAEFTFPGYCIQRYLRLVPAMGYVMWTCTSLLPHLSSGPVWERTYEGLFGRPCANAAWSNLLFLNNFSDPSDMCLGHLWSLAVEWQLYLVAPLLLLPVYRWPSWRWRWLPLAACLTMSVLLPAFITLVNDLPPTATHWNDEATRAYYSTYYVVPWCRAGPYLVGLAAGVLYHWLDENNLILTQGCVRACGAACWAVAVIVVVGPSWINGSGTLWAAVYSSLARPAWAAALAFFVINAFKGQPGVPGAGGPVSECPRQRGGVAPGRGPSGTPPHPSHLRQAMATPQGCQRCDRDD
ncbi:nose resistant to fluoxetine protein 6-like isoform X2 [Portunus trituberculatus]|uniref:nose resistant to fluoxetine protein 6-like isoform X2 n=1 Tax=Portunus trituberculatus TaxID=210409 RepID=UPI001E1CE758|nr:nose resistant to fluoxetine protein 6-like isoform X2 [Portunus trituberculatus]